MKILSQDSHLSPEELLMLADGELLGRQQARAEAHLAACWACRSRKLELEATIGRFVEFYRDSSQDQLPAADGPRALLRARIRQMEIGQSELGQLEVDEEHQPRWFHSGRWQLAWTILAAGLAMVCAAALMWHGVTRRSETQLTKVTIPNHALTPGATIALSRLEVCQQASANNKKVSRAVQREVFAEYGIPSTHPDAYEVDYLITPALGGADDIHNLWPQSARTVGWSAEVKDALEDHLRNLVCDGRLDLATAQREIATNWIDTYKKYFQTDRPLTTVR